MDEEGLKATTTICKRHQEEDRREGATFILFSREKKESICNCMFMQREG